MRNPDGTWAQGSSGNPGGMTPEEYDKLTKVRRLAQNRSFAAVKSLERLMGDENGKVAVAAALGILKVAGVFGDEARIQREVETRLKQLLEEAQNSGPPRLTAVG